MNKNEIGNIAVRYVAEKILCGLVDRGVPLQRLTPEFIITFNNLIMGDLRLVEILQNPPANFGFSNIAGAQSSDLNSLNSDLLDWATDYVDRSLRNLNLT